MSTPTPNMTKKKKKNIKEFVDNFAKNLKAEKVN